MNEVAMMVRNSIKMFSLFFDSYVAAQLKECCENNSDRWEISAREHKEFVEDYTGIVFRFRDASDYYDECEEIISIVADGKDYNTEEVFEILAGECWDILNTHNWYMDYYDEWLKDKEDE